MSNISLEDLIKFELIGFTSSIDIDSQIEKKDCVKFQTMRYKMSFDGPPTVSKLSLQLSMLKSVILSSLLSLKGEIAAIYHDVSIEETVITVESWGYMKE